MGVESVEWPDTFDDTAPGFNTPRARYEHAAYVQRGGCTNMCQANNERCDDVLGRRAWGGDLCLPLRERLQ